MLAFFYRTLYLLLEANILFPLPLFFPTQPWNEQLQKSCSRSSENCTVLVSVDKVSVDDVSVVFAGKVNVNEILIQ